MIVFYSGSGAQGFEILSNSMFDYKWIELKHTVSRLLRAQKKHLAEELLNSISFDLSEGTNVFGDEFFVLHTSVPIKRYVELTELKTNPDVTIAFREIALAFKELEIYVRFILAEVSLKTVELVEQPEPKITTKVVERALRDSQQLIYTSGAASAVDRAHTALHGYLRAICQNAKIPFEDQVSLTELFKILRKNHSAFDTITVEAEESKRLFGALATIVDTLNTLRNRASIAHPNDSILEEAEAILAVNCVRTIFHYLNARLK